MNKKTTKTIPTCMKAWSMYRWLPVIAVTAGCGAPAEGDPDLATQTGQHAFVDSSAIWSSSTISVCWESGAMGDATSRTLVRDAVRDSWERFSAVRFTGWGTCSSSSQGIRIRVADENARTQGLGENLDGMVGGMTLNFTYRSWSKPCNVDETTRQACLYTHAIHEFGHALGFAHEHNRADTPDTCTRAPQGHDGDTTLSAWDANSVMNYCNAATSTAGVRANLSPADQTAAISLYGGVLQSIRGSSGWSYYRNSALWQSQLGVGDFDGDGTDDMFRANGTNFSYMPRGGTEFVALFNSAYPRSSVMLADFNGDRRTDVFRADGSRWYVYYAGSTTGWTQINASAYPLSALRVADFNGDGRADVFRTDGSAWWVSFGGTGGWTKINTSTAPLSQLTFGDFNGDRRADVFRAFGGVWSLSNSGSGGWTTLNVSNYTTSELTLADFNGDRRADVFRADGGAWWVSTSGSSGWAQLNTSNKVRSQLLIGNFDGVSGADVLHVVSPH